MLRSNNYERSTLSQVIHRYYALWMIYAFGGGFLFGVYPVFLHARGLSQFEINSVLAIYFIIVFMTDVPTGAFADALGRRLSFLLGTLLRAAAFLTYFFSYSYGAFILAESIDAIGTTFANGAVDAWGVDAIDEAGFDELKDRLFSRIAQLTSAGFMGSALIGAYVADVDIAWPWLLGAAGYLVSAGAGAVLMRDRRRLRARPDFSHMGHKVIARVSGGLREGFASRPILYLSAAGAITFAAWSPYWVEWPLLFTERYGVGIWVVGWIFSLLTGARMLGNEIAARLSPDQAARSSRVSALIVGASAFLFLAGMFSHRANVALVMLFAMNVCTGAIFPLVVSWFNEQIEPQRRATLLSFNSTCQTVGGSMGLLLGGYVADAAGVAVGWEMAGVISVAAAPLYWALRRRTSETEVRARVLP